MEEEEAITNAEDYASQNALQVIERIGSGIHGIVFFVTGKPELGMAAIKAHFSDEPYRRERDIYRRLQQLKVTEVRSFEVPLLLDVDDKLRVLKLTIVAPPFVLDFAGAYLDSAPQMSEEIWAEWEQRNEERFGADWPFARILLKDLNAMGIYMLDPSPSNICFR
ncbi:MAG: hypothetical protein JO076_11240 [Verrucomicrobia bacterium]|nr:hypothetical protein [Verrucomicrobiota bacterium]